MPKLWRMQSNPSLPSFPGPLWPGVVAPDRVIKLFIFNQLALLFPLRSDQLTLFKTFVTRRDYYGLSFKETPVSLAYKNHNTSGSSLYIRNALTLNKRKERQDKPIYTYRNI